MPKKNYSGDAPNKNVVEAGQIAIGAMVALKLQPAQMVELLMNLVCFIAISARKGNISRLELEDNLVKILRNEYKICYDSPSPHRVFEEFQRSMDGEDDK